MQCSEIREMLSGYIDCVLDKNEEEAVRNHLQECAECNRELADLQETIRLLQSLGDIQLPEGFREQLREKLEKEPVPAAAPVTAGWKNRVRRWVGGPWKYAAAAVLIAGIGISLTSLYNLSPLNSLGQKGVHSYGSPEVAMDSGVQITKNDEVLTNNLKHSSKEKGQDSPMEGLGGGSAESGQDTTLYSITAQDGVRGEKSEGNESNKNLDTSLRELKAPPGAGILNDVPEKPGQKIIKDGFIGLEVENYRVFGLKLMVVVEQHGGYLENSSESGGDIVTANMVIRVPVRNFSELMRRIETLGEVTGKQISGRDVTAEFVDTESRLRNLQRQEQRLLQLVDKAQSLSDVLTLENELKRIREEIELLQGRLKGLDDQATYSTIRLEVKETAKPAITTPQGVFGKAVQNFKASLVTLMNFLGDIVKFIGWVLPWAVAVVGIPVGIYVYKKYKNKSKSDSDKND